MKLLLVVLSLIYCVFGLNLEIPAETNLQPVCVRDFVQADQLVVVNIKTSGKVGDGQLLDLTVFDSLGNEYRRKKNLAGTAKIAFTALHSTAVDICFINQPTNGRWTGHGKLFREVELEIESGAAARDWNAVQTAEKLKPVEVELRRIQEMTMEISQELQYLKAREERMRDTNESTNSRVKWFSIIVVLALVGLGVWQIHYLRHYFKVKHII